MFLAAVSLTAACVCTGICTCKRTRVLYDDTCSHVTMIYFLELCELQ